MDNQQAQPQDPRLDPNLIRVFDKFGRELFVAKDVWRKDVLPGALRSHWEEPDQLYNVIVGALTDGFVTDVLEAAERLYAIDPHRDRAAAILGIVLMETGRLDDSERLLTDYVAEHGEDAVILTNLAKIYASRDHHQRAEQMLWRALELDPNMDNGFGWFVAIWRDRGGDDAAEEALRRIAAIPGSWRARLWLARGAMQDQRVDDALAAYRECLSILGRPVPADLLMQMSGDLGNAGLLGNMIELCQPLFIPSIHGLAVGNNLIKAHVELSNLDEAARIVDNLQSMGRPDWKETLCFWEGEIAEKRLTSAPAPSTPQFTVLRIRGPIWLGPAAEELFPPKPSGAVKVAFLGSSAERASAPGGSRVEWADAPGRMSRALPLFFAEQVHLGSPAAGETLLPYVIGSHGGAILAGEPFSDDWILDYAHRENIGAFVVATHLKCDAGQGGILEFRLIRTADGKRLADGSASFAFQDPSEPVLGVAKILLDALRKEIAGEASGPFPGYLVPAGSNFGDYLLRLEQLQAVRCQLVEGVPPHSLKGEREILDGNLNRCLRCPGSLNIRLLLAQTVHYMNKVRPDVVAEFKDKLDMLEQHYPIEGRGGDAVRSIIRVMSPSA